MKVLINLSYYLMWFLLILTLFGLYKPWLALWWSDYATRKKVCKTYGLSFLVCMLLYLGLNWI